MKPLPVITYGKGIAIKKGVFDRRPLDRRGREGEGDTGSSRLLFGILLCVEPLVDGLAGHVQQARNRCNAHFMRARQ